jgi:hypothetical protein
VRSAPVRVAPAVRTGTVRSEHYEGSPSRAAYRNPYRDDYFRHFRPGYSPYILDGAQYYGYDDLPPGYQTVVIDGITYYLFQGVYYQPYIYGAALSEKTFVYAASLIRRVRARRIFLLKPPAAASC